MNPVQEATDLLRDALVAVVGVRHYRQRKLGLGRVRRPMVG